MYDKYIALARCEDVPQGSCKSFDMPDAAGLKIIVAHLGDGFYAVENRCTHLGSMLDTSRIYRGRRIACPTHYAQFDLKTGAAKTAPAFRSLATYSVRITDGMITVATSTRI